jgi:hypothetical protein
VKSTKRSNVCSLRQCLAVQHREVGSAVVLMSIIAALFRVTIGALARGEAEARVFAATTAERAEQVVPGLGDHGEAPPLCAQVSAGVSFAGLGQAGMWDVDVGR